MFDSHPLKFQLGSSQPLGPLSGMDETGFIVKFSFRLDDNLVG